MRCARPASEMLSLATWERISGALYADLESGFKTSADERAWVDARAGRGAATYGEIAPTGMARLLGWLRLEEDDVFYDLGSGTGKFVLAALATTRVGRAIGIELARHRHAQALAARDRLRAFGVGTGDDARCRFDACDLRAVDLADATVIYACSTCFDDELLSELAAQATRATRLRTLVSTRPLPGTWARVFDHLGTMRVDMCWSPRVRLHVYRQRRATD